MVPGFQSYSTDPILNVEPMQLLIKDTLHIYVINFNEKETQFFNIIWLPISLICYGPKPTSHRLDLDVLSGFLVSAFY